MQEGNENGVTRSITLYKPCIEDLWFRKMLLADPETMSYNTAWGGTIQFCEDRWQDWYDEWVDKPDKRFYRYVTVGASKAFVGETAWHYDGNEQKYIADVIIMARDRGKGFGKAALELLCREARKQGITELYDDIALDNPGVKLFLNCGFMEEYRTDQIIMVKKTLG